VNSYNTAVLDGNPDLDAVIVALRLQLGRLPAERFDYVILAKVASDRHGLALARPHAGAHRGESQDRPAHQHRERCRPRKPALQEAPLGLLAGTL